MINNIEMKSLSRPWSADGIKLLNNQLIVMSVQGDSLRSEVRKDVPLDGVPSTSRIPREQKKRNHFFYVGSNCIFVELQFTVD